MSLEPRWDKVEKKVLNGMENLVAQEQLQVIQAQATVDALHEMRTNLESDTSGGEILEMKMGNIQRTIDQAEPDLELKERTLTLLQKKYREFMDNTILNTSSFEDIQEKK